MKFEVTYGENAILCKYLEKKLREIANEIEERYNCYSCHVSAEVSLYFRNIVKGMDSSSTCKKCKSLQNITKKNTNIKKKVPKQNDGPSEYEKIRLENIADHKKKFQEIFKCTEQDQESTESDSSGSECEADYARLGISPYDF